ncbi:MAG TPA: hypothetical protein VEW03_15820, partial [Longimicrobiaceae bacterium]|nr:hypothetical protein [Longimicrobiaceae bacterium]
KERQKLAGYLEQGEKLRSKLAAFGRAELIDSLRAAMDRRAALLDVEGEKEELAKLDSDIASLKARLETARALSAGRREGVA